MNYLKIFSPPHVIARARLAAAPFLNPLRSVHAHGIELHVDTRNYPGRCLWAYRDLYEREDIRMLDQMVHPGETVIDIGANAGIYTVRCAQLVGAGRVIAFEGNPSEVPTLRQNVAPYPQVEIVEAFCTDGSEFPAWGVPTKGVRVDDVVSGQVHFIKVDVDGIDLMVLKGCERILRKDRPRLLVEIGRDNDYIKAHHGIASPREIFEWLAQFGYRPHHVRPGFPLFTEQHITQIQNLLFTA